MPWAADWLRLAGWLLLASVIVNAHSFGAHNHFYNPFGVGNNGRGFIMSGHQRQQSFTPARMMVYPGGFTMSLPADNPDVHSMRFEGSCMLRNGQRGDFSFVARQPVNGRWTYMNRDMPLHRGDVIDYRVSATSRARNMQYVCDQQSYTVNGES